jgi:hypothetical protein
MYIGASKYKKICSCLFLINYFQTSHDKQQEENIYIYLHLYVIVSNKNVYFHHVLDT